MVVSLSHRKIEIERFKWAAHKLNCTNYYFLLMRWWRTEIRFPMNQVCLASHILWGLLNSLTSTISIMFVALVSNWKTSWWLNQPNWKIWSSNWIIISPRFGVKLKNLWVATTFELVFPKIMGKPPKWMVKIMESPNKMHDLGVPLFLEIPSIYLKKCNPQLCSTYQSPR